ncbi:peptide chain release factor N(5)-glutamine methyltransferase [Aurantimonas coralicida]|uniref:peptide chain release factor N(5)-glutamine methyltransferase n=1 Tax=Aurantimonas coralicida TaxID=182270 RepID=UPI001D18F4DE|nr:peptide chain release factor N(5)-glutamine methyltransferase [Aurantimonas coralicida]MCC4298011.1 peptide chain release factor N(5)-glutamine methyltransferase [Aurantimonas coralicida]
MPDEPGGPTLGDCLRDGQARLRAAGCDTPDLDARLLLAEICDRRPGEVHSASGAVVSAADAARFDAVLARRAAGEPVHRIIGRRAFYEHDFVLSPETLEPRPDTEVLVEEARKAMAAIVARDGRCVFADVGTGTGAIAVSLLALFAEAEAVALDISDGALQTARRNAIAAGVADRMHTVRANYLDAIGGPLELVVSNPPYIPHDDIAALSREVRDHDPLLALDGGADGLDAYRALATGARRIVRSQGLVIVEIGVGQESDVAAIFAAEGFILDAATRDLGGVIRVLTLRLAIGGAGSV